MLSLAYMHIFKGHRKARHHPSVCMPAHESDICKQMHHVLFHLNRIMNLGAIVNGECQLRYIHSE